eukprot:scaffold18065_cov59-Phaeocystis_antarctica.AAC.6
MARLRSDRVGDAWPSRCRATIMSSRSVVVPQGAGCAELGRAKRWPRTGNSPPLRAPWAVASSDWPSPTRQLARVLRFTASKPLATFEPPAASALSPQPKWRSAGCAERGRARRPGPSPSRLDGAPLERREGASSRWRSAGCDADCGRAKRRLCTDNAPPPHAPCAAAIWASGPPATLAPPAPPALLGLRVCATTAPENTPCMGVESTLLLVHGVGGPTDWDDGVGGPAAAI